MVVELRVTYDGTEPGLSEHRLSVAAFAEPLRRLLTALQRTGSALISSALDDPSYGERGGKFAKDAALLDLELVTIREGSAAPSFLAVARPDRRNLQVNLFNDLPARAVERLVQDIHAEARGVAQSAAARKYLASLPSGVTRQKYTAVQDGTTLVEVEFGHATLPEFPPDLPRLIRVRGNVVAVGFEPAAPFVTIRSEGRASRCVATKELVDLALALRGGEVEAAILETQDSRLMWIRSAEGEIIRSSLNEALARMDARWGRTLARLAQ